nr:hypothetical protein CFP56_66777 [Quercus suber]
MRSTDKKSIQMDLKHGCQKLEYNKSIKEYSLQCFLFLSNIPLGYSVQFSSCLVKPISSFKLCYQYGYKMDLMQRHQKLVSKSGWSS